MTLAGAVTIPAEAGLPARIPFPEAPSPEFPTAARTASGSVPSESSTLGMCRRLSSHCVLLAAGCDNPPKALARPFGVPGVVRQCLTGLSEVQEEDVLPALKGARLLQLPAHQEQLPADFPEAGHQQVLWQLPKAGKQPRPPQRSSHQHAPDPATGGGLGDQPGHLLFRVLGCLAELGIRCQGRVIQPEVVGKDSQDVCRLLQPSRQSDVDFTHCPLAVPVQEPSQAGVQASRQLPGMESGRQVGRILRQERGA